MKLYTVIILTTFGLVSGCTGELRDWTEEFGIQETTGSNITWAEAGRTILTVRGQNYNVQKNHGRDRKTSELIVVQYDAIIDGKRINCGVGSIENCREGIERYLDRENSEFVGGD